jgi:hypothetical protein
MKRISLLTDEIGRIVHEDIFAKYCGYLAGLEEKPLVYRAERAILRSLKAILTGPAGSKARNRSDLDLIRFANSCEDALNPAGIIGSKRQALYAQAIQASNFARQNNRDSDGLVYEVLANVMSHAPEHDGALAKLLGILRLTRKASNGETGLATALHLLGAVYLDRHGDGQSFMVTVAMIYTRVASETVGMELLTC